MKKISEKYGFRMKIFILFLLLVILPYLLVITTIYRMFLDYTGKTWFPMDIMVSSMLFPQFLPV